MCVNKFNKRMQANSRYIFIKDNIVKAFFNLKITLYLTNKSRHTSCAKHFLNSNQYQINNQLIAPVVYIPNNNNNK